MTQARSKQVCLESTPFYHVVSRCVRRTFLCGFDRSTGQSYEHRRSWIEDRIRLLSSIFAVDVCSYAVMSNHYHIVLKLCPEQVERLTSQDVIKRWLCLFKGPALVQKYSNNQELSPIELQAVSDCVEQYRKRLASLSWFMKCLNETIARQANREDNCTGHFWESRYKSQALFTEEAVLSAMCYVDLNPIRAGMASTPETSEHTSIKERIKPRFNAEKAVTEQTELGAIIRFDLPIKPLLPFDRAIINTDQQGLPYAFDDYLELIDFTGRAVLRKKRGAIASQLPPILTRLAIPTKSWLTNTTQFEAIYRFKFSKRPPPLRKAV